MMRLTRRTLLGSAAALGAGLAMPNIARAEDDESLWDQFGKDRMLRGADTDGNTASAKSLIDTIEPILSFDTAYNLQLAIQNYQAFVDAHGSWELPSRDTFALELGKSRRAVAALKRRLMINGDMTYEKRVNDDFDNKLDAAVRLFQARHGLIINGKIDEPTFYALSVPTDYRLNQLRLNLARIEQWATALSEDYVVVNIPAASIEAIEASQVVQRHTAVVGKVERATPILNSKVHQVKFNPYWTVPKSIIEKDLVRYMNEDPEYLTKFRIRIFDGQGTEVPPTTIDWSSPTDAVRYTFRQDPGGENSMGHCKIDFYNPYDVYMHDTPFKDLFGDNNRFYSSGCMRIQNIQGLVTWLLRDSGWTPQQVEDALRNGQRLDAKLKGSVPVYTNYITAWATREGVIHFRDDIYNRDGVGMLVAQE